MKERKTIIIIGGGVSGLSAGIYAEQHGLNAIILEKNPVTGGLCTGWTRRGFEIDGCLHWLTGTSKDDCLYEMWRNAGVITCDEDIYQPASWGSFDLNSKQITFWCDLQRAEKEWITISPVDTKQIKKFFKLVRDIASVNLPLERPVSMLPFKTILKLGLSVLKVLPNYIGSMNISCEKYALRFKSPEIRYAISHIQPGIGNLYSMVFSYATVVKGDGGLLLGGAKELTRRMEERFVSLGGTLKTNSPVRHVLVKDDSVVGVKLEDDSKIYGDYVVSCVDAGFTLNKLLLGQYQTGHKKRFDNPEKYQTPSCCFISLAIEDLPDFISPLNFKVEPFKCGASEIESINLRSYVFDKTFSKDNKQVCTVLVDQYAKDFDVWNKLYKEDKKAYQQAKKELGETVINKIISHFPELENKITLLDVATPRTYTNYCNSTKGAYMSFLFGNKTGLYNMNGKVRGLKNFYLGSQWVQCPGGLPLALACGRFAIQRICKKENIKLLMSPNKLKTRKAENKI